MSGIMRRRRSKVNVDTRPLQTAGEVPMQYASFRSPPHSATRSKSFDPYDLAHVGPDFQWQDVHLRWQAEHGSRKVHKTTKIVTTTALPASSIPDSSSSDAFSTSPATNQSQQSPSAGQAPSSSSHHVHSNRASLLDSDVPEHSFRGLVNLVILMLVLSNARLVLDNIMKYGLLVDFSAMFGSFLGDPYSWPSLSLFLYMQLHILASFLIEKSISEGKMSEVRGSLMHTLNFAGVIVIPTLVIWIVHPFAVGSLINMMVATILFLKLYSYAAVNEEHRQRYLTKGHDDMDDGPVRYPANLIPADILYFMAAPTLVYSLNFPRTERVRVGYVLKCATKLILLSAVIISLAEQYMAPLIRNSVDPYDRDVLRMTERTLKLAVPNLYVWLLGFYAFFHVYLNMVAELLRFADRRFYSDWWNSNSIDYFWRNWNIPVHRWMVRHVYIPLVRKRGWSRFAASVAIFAISGFFHELIISVPFGIIKFWAFGGMMAQVPLAVMSRAFTRQRHWGNILFWSNIIIGQAYLILTYAKSIFEEMKT